MTKNEMKYTKLELEDAIAGKKYLVQILETLNEESNRPNRKQLRELAEQYGLDLPVSKIGKVTTLPLTKQELEKAIEGSTALSQVCRNLGRSATGAELANLKRYAMKYGQNLPSGGKWGNLLKQIPKDVFASAVLNSNSIKETIDLLNLKTDTDGYKKVKFLAKSYEIELTKASSKMIAQASREGRMKTRIPNEEIFQMGVPRSQSTLRKRLIETGRDYLCTGEGCPNPKPEWAGLPLTLQLDHADGDIFNNTQNNLRFLCPNCHTQTETYGSKNMKKGKKEIWNHCSCGKRIAKESERCVPCNRVRDDHPFTIINSRKPHIEWPPLKDMIIRIEAIGYSAYGKELGVSDNGIRKHLRSKEVDPLPKLR